MNEIKLKLAQNFPDLFDLESLCKTNDTARPYKINCKIHGPITNRKERLISLGCHLCNKEKERLKRLEIYKQSIEDKKDFIIDYTNFESIKDKTNIF